MCTVSMVGDFYADKWGPRFPQLPIQPQIVPYAIPNPIPFAPVVATVPREEFDALKREVEDMKALLIRAKLYDERNNEPECEQEEKMELLRRVAKAVGISLDDVIGPSPNP